MCSTLSSGLVSPVLGGSGGLVGGTVSSIALVFAAGVLGVAVGAGASSSSASSWTGSNTFNSDVFLSSGVVAFCSASFGPSASRGSGTGSNAFPYRCVVASSDWRGVVANWRHDLRGRLLTRHARDALSCNFPACVLGVAVFLYSMGHKNGNLGAAIALVFGGWESSIV